MCVMYYKTVKYSFRWRRSIVIETDVWLNKINDAEKKFKISKINSKIAKKKNLSKLWNS